MYIRCYSSKKSQYNNYKTYFIKFKWINNDFNQYIFLFYFGLSVFIVLYGEKNRGCDSVETKEHLARGGLLLAEERKDELWRKVRQGAKGGRAARKEGVFCCQWCNLKYLFYEQCKWTIAVEETSRAPFVSFTFDVSFAAMPSPLPPCKWRL